MVKPPKTCIQKQEMEKLKKKKKKRSDIEN